MGLPRQEYWSGLPFLIPRDLSDLGNKLKSPTLQTDSLLSEPPKKPHMGLCWQSESLLLNKLSRFVILIIAFLPRVPFNFNHPVHGLKAKGDSLSVLAR